jgi:hypothetical protein
MTGKETAADLLPETAAELRHWQDEGRKARVWWRDDDAVADSLNLQRLLSITRDSGLPLTLAVIPEKLETSLADALAGISGVTVMQHGIAHRNRATDGGKKCELVGGDRAEETLAGLDRGRRILADAFGDGFRPYLAPPWNRIAADVTAWIGEAGLSGISLYTDRPKGLAADVPAVHTHLDIIDWKAGRSFIGAGFVDKLFAAALNRRREGEVAERSAIGLLTHHLVHDLACDGFTRAFATFVSAHPALECCNIEEAFQGT